ncbi:hypothetical protein L0666_04990 [Octadecabacter sp. CECT 8868]|uniref:hypothetical protein n=1 Tax=Octadecabacter algicola TaxID=2909342 RepID=UPI001F3E3016|nr:hypothetical protein [Octadecabacter algicola]MCF2904333.1 hypothetical protein [Octadecabacter algicola]
MGGIKTYTPIGLMAFFALTAPAPTSADIENPLHYFASCTGRLSAQMEHEWLLSDENAEQTEDQRAAMIDLLFATMEPDEGRQVLAWRIEAKSAHAGLLTRATFREDTWAAQRAVQMVRACTAIMMS